MGTFVTDEDAPMGSASAPATHRQLSLISHLIETRWVSDKCASRIIGLLNDQPLVGTDGLEDLKAIQRGS